MEGHVIEGFGIVGKDLGEPWSSKIFCVKAERIELNHDKEKEYGDTHSANIVQQTIKKPWTWVLSFD